jgi:hypothetical protein
MVHNRLALAWYFTGKPLYSLSFSTYWGAGR